MAAGGTPVSSIRNLGPAFEQACTRAGIQDAETLRALGADEAYARLLAAGERPHFIGYYVLHMALQGRPWNDCKGDEKAALRRSFDAIKSRNAQSDAALSPDLARFLRDIGLSN
ncbi:TfoX/Sxy family protein [Citreimonas sp.]|uniref:TfoX/Sxy family protein n=1 Tax=Citreimonas sp. TaxID=3036715 RepID=UPI0035C79379